MDKFIELQVKKLKELKNNDDLELTHKEADNILCNVLLYLNEVELVVAFNQLDKWYA